MPAGESWRRGAADASRIESSHAWHDAPVSNRKPPRSSAKPAHGSARFGIARVISKAGLCSRSAAELMVRAGRVEIDGQLVLDPEFPVHTALRDRVRVDGTPLVVATRAYIMLNKPRGLVVTARDEHARETVFACLEVSGLPLLAPVGRLDRASEGLLLLCNDSGWAAGITAPESHVSKTYRVQVGRVPTAEQLAALRTGVRDQGEMLVARSIETLRSGGKTAWLEIVLHGGRNRQIRRMLTSVDLPVLRLIRVAIGSLALGDLRKGAWRHLTPAEVAAFAQSAR